jgi:ribonuclease R
MGHRDGHGFVTLGGDRSLDVYLSPQEMKSVLHRDRVRVRVMRYDRKGRAEGHVLDIVSRHPAPIMGRLLHENGAWIVAPEDKRFGHDILIARHATADAKAGQVVAVELTQPPALNVQPQGRVAEVLGDIDDPGMEIEIAVRKFEVPHRFSDATLAQAAALPEAIRAADRRGRIDLRDVPLVTIDGEDARDFDDAVYAEPMTLGRGKSAQEAYRLIVAIADVSHYVKPGEPLDRDALERATSVYFPRRVIPMLPERLSNGLCSLNPNVERLALVCDMVVQADGDIHAYQFYPAVFVSHARLTYDEVAEILLNTQGPHAQRRSDLVPHLVHLHEVFRARLKERHRRGAIDFETTETQILCDDNGRIERIVPRTRNDAHRLIEESMLAANVCAAEFVASAKHPSLYRVHEGPTPEKRVALQAQLRALGVGVNVSDDPTPKEMQAVADAVRHRPDAAQIHMLLLRSMQQAIYTAALGGHFGLSFEAYTHFTSPIRRYPDLMVHRVIKAVLASKTFTLAADSVPAPSASPRLPPARGKAAMGGKVAVKTTVKSTTPPGWEALGLHCSTNERRADDASRDVEAWLKTRYMRDRLGETFAGTVSGVTGFGLFVQLDELHVDGLVHITELGGEYYRFDEVRQELRGEKTGVRWGVGVKLHVQVSRVDLDSRKIDFRVVRDGQPEALLDRGRMGKRTSSTSSPSVAASGSQAMAPTVGRSESDAVAELAAVRRTDAQLRVARANGVRDARRATPAKKGASPKRAPKVVRKKR